MSFLAFLLIRCNALHRLAQAEWRLFRKWQDEEFSPLTCRVLAGSRYKSISCAGLWFVVQVFSVCAYQIQVVLLRVDIW